jgi:hypothetical protein
MHLDTWSFIHLNAIQADLQKPLDVEAKVREWHDAKRFVVVATVMIIIISIKIIKLIYNSVDLKCQSLIYELDAEVLFETRQSLT